jgi:hypothetical protein
MAVAAPIARYGYSAAQQACSRYAGEGYSVQPGACAGTFSLIKAMSGTRPILETV